MLLHDTSQYVVFVNNLGDIVKKLVLLVFCLISTDVVANLTVVDLPPVVRHALANRLAEVVVREGFIPLVSIASSITPSPDQPPLLDEYRRKLAEKFYEEPHFISSYANIFKEENLLTTMSNSPQQHTPEAVRSLMVDMQNMIHTVARDYAEQQDGVVLVENDITTQFLEELEISLSQYWQFTSSKFEQMEDILLDKYYNSVSMHRFYRDLSHIYRNQRQEEDRAAASDMVDFLEDFPEFDQRLPGEVYKRVLQLASREQTTFKELDKKLIKILSLSQEVSTNPARTLEISNIINFSSTSFAMEGNRITLGKGFTSRQEGISHFDRELIENSLRVNYRVALTQLTEERFLAGATTELLSSMGWNWSEFAQIIYPNDSEKAALFVEDYHRLIHDTEVRDNMIQGLQDEEARLSEYRENSVINQFIAELPLLVEKEKVMAVFSVTLQDDSYEELEFSYKLSNAFDDYKRDLINWRTLSSKDLAETIPTVATVINLLKRGGLTSNQELAAVFTPQVFNKLVLGKIVTEQELNELRLQLSELNFNWIDNQVEFKRNINIMWVLFYLMGKVMGKDDDEILKRDENNLYSFYYMLPLIIQYDGFLKKIANGSRSNKNLHRALEAIEKDSMYHPLAVKLLHDLENKSRRERNILLNKIRADLKALEPINKLISGNYILPEGTQNPAEEQAVKINRSTEE